MNTKSFRIPIENVGLAHERMDKLARRAEKLGISFPDITYGEPYKTFRRDITGQILVNWWVDVTLEGEGIDRPVSYGGWRIIAQFNHEYPKVILNKLGDYVNPVFISRFEAENVSWCQHCHKAIRRKNTYVISREDDGSQMLVGSSCMHHFVPDQKPIDQVMAFYMHVMEEFHNRDEEGLGWAGESKFVDTYTYLRSCFMVLLTGVSVRDERFGEIVGHVMTLTLPKREYATLYRLVTKAFEKYDDAESEMFHLQKFIEDLPEGNEFNVRLKRMCEPGYHLIKDNNTVKWGAVKYYDYLHRDVPVNVSEWMGEVGERLEDVPVTFVGGKYLYDSMYDSVYLYTFKTKEGNIITWKTSYTEEEFLVGDIEITGRIKEHTEFRGVKQTQITRAKIKRL